MWDLRGLPVFFRESGDGVDFVGRAEELAALDFRRDATGVPQSSVVLVRGMPGAGKSALLAAYRDRTESSSEAKVSLVTCSQGAEEPFSPFRRIVRDIVDPKSPVAQPKGRRYAAAAGRAMLELGPEFAALVFPPAALIGAAGRHVLEESGVVGLRKAGRTPDYRGSDREHVSDFVEFFRTMAPGTPHVIIIDDLHWADEASIALFGRLSAFLAQDPSTQILLVGSYRTHEVRADPGHALRAVLNQVQRRWGDVAIDLEAGGAAADYVLTGQLVNAFAPNAVGGDFVRRLYEATLGNPLHVTEVLEAMLLTGDLIEEQGLLVARPDLSWDHAPTRLDSALAARIDRLSSDANGVLTTASVQGIDFSADVVAGARRRDIEDVLPILTDELDTSHVLVRDLGRSDTEPVVFRFKFRHPEYRRFVYEGSTKSTRKLAHEKIAESLLEIYAGAESEVALDVAAHYMAAGLPRLAGPWYLEAAAAARGAQALPDARNIALEGLAVPVGIDSGTEAQLRLIAGETNAVLGRYDAAMPHLLRAQELAQELGDSRLSAESLVWLGHGAWRRDDVDAAYRYLTVALAEAQEVGAPEIELGAMRNLGVLARKQG